MYETSNCFMFLCAIIIISSSIQHLSASSQYAIIVLNYAAFVSLSKVLNQHMLPSFHLSSLQTCALACQIQCINYMLSSCSVKNDIVDFALLLPGNG